MQKKWMVFGNLIAYLLFVGVWVLAYLFYREYVLFVLLCILILFCPVSYLCVNYMQKKIRVEFRFTKPQSEKNEEFELLLRLCNPTHFVSRNSMITLIFQNSFCEGELTRHIVLPIHAADFRGNSGETGIRIRFRGEHCGRIQCVITEFTIYDWLGIAAFEKKLVAGSSVDIVPRELEVQVNTEHMGGGVGECEEQPVVTGTEESTEVSELRNYRPGDRLQRVHWKLSSKQEDYLVKEFLTPSDHEITVLLDYSKEETEAVIELFYAVLLKLCRAGISYEVQFPTEDGLQSLLVDQEAQTLEVLRAVYEEAPTETDVYAMYYDHAQENSGNVLLITTAAHAKTNGLSAREKEAEHQKAVAVWI